MDIWSRKNKGCKFIFSYIFNCFNILLIIFNFFDTLALNKSRNLLSEDQLNSFLPTIRTQQFSDSFKGFTFIAEKNQE